MSNVRKIHGTMSTDNMDARCQSIHDEKYCQVFGNKQFFVEAYPIKKESDFHLVLDKFVQEYEAPYKMTYDGAQEQIGRNIEFQRVMRNDKIKGHVTEKNGQNKTQQKDAYEKYDEDGIVPCSGRIAPELCRVMGYHMQPRS